MAWTTPRDWTALELVTAAYMDQISDNLNELWKGTTAGDMDYYTSSTAKSRLGIGTEYQFLQTNSGATAPEWGGLHYASVYHNTTQTASNGSVKNLAFNSEAADPQGWHDTVTNNTRVTVGVTGGYSCSIFCDYTAAGGSGGYWDTIYLYLNGSEVMSDRRRQEVDANGKRFAVTFPVYPATAGQYFEARIEQNSGDTRTIQANARFSVWRVY